MCLSKPSWPTCLWVKVSPIQSSHFGRMHAGLRLLAYTTVMTSHLRSTLGYASNVRRVSTCKHFIATSRCQTNLCTSKNPNLKKLMHFCLMTLKFPSIHRTTSTLVTMNIGHLLLNQCPSQWRLYSPRLNLGTLASSYPNFFRKLGNLFIHSMR